MASLLPGRCGALNHTFSNKAVKAPGDELAQELAGRGVGGCGGYLEASGEVFVRPEGEEAQDLEMTHDRQDLRSGMPSNNIHRRGMR